MENRLTRKTVAHACTKSILKTLFIFAEVSRRITASMEMAEYQRMESCGGPRIKRA